MFKITLIKIFQLLSIFVLITSSICAQTAPGIEWQNTIGGVSDEQQRGVLQNANSGYYCGGSSDSNISGDKTENGRGSYDYWVVKLGSNGIIQWDKTVGGSLYDHLRDIDITSDDGLICGGPSSSNVSGDKTEDSQGGYDYWVVKLDSSSNILWQNTIGGASEDVLESIEQTHDNGFICGGFSHSDISGDKTEDSQGGQDYWVIKLDSVGNIEWQNTIGGFGLDQLYVVKQTSDKGFICGGWSESNISGDKSQNCWGFKDYWVVKLDSLGNIQWDKTFGGSLRDQLRGIVQTSDGGYICGGFSDSDISGDKTENSQGGQDYWVIKLDSVGNIEWQNTIGGVSDDRLLSVEKTNDGGYICGGLSHSDISGDKTQNSRGSSDYWVVKLDPSGSIQWQKTIGGDEHDALTSIHQTADDGYICGGFSYSNISGDKTENSNGDHDYWVVKLESISTSVASIEDHADHISLFPNPAIDHFTIKFEGVNDDKISAIELIDIDGKLVESRVNDISKEESFNTQYLTPGLYSVRVTLDSGKVINKTVSVIK